MGTKSLVEVRVPDLGNYHDVEVIDLVAKPGDTIEVEGALITLETEKATMDVPSTVAGVVRELKVQRGSRVNQGDVIALVESGDAAAPSPAKKGKEEKKPSPQPAPAKAEAGEDKTPSPPPSPARAGEGAGKESLVEVRVPDLGNYHDVEVIDLVAKAGDTVEVEGALITLETEKATMDVPSTVAGVVRELKVQRGARVNQGDVIAVVESGGAAAPSTAKPSPPPSPAKAGKGEEKKPSPQPSPAGAKEGDEKKKPSPERSPQPSPPPSAARAAEGEDKKKPAFDEPGFSKAHASPSIRKLARELGVDLARVKGTGDKDRITDADVKAYVKRALTSAPAPGTGAAAALPKVPQVDFAAFGPVERKPLSRIQKISGPRLHASWVNLPHVTQFDDADITDMEQTRAGLKQQATERGIKLTPLAFIMRACAQALAEFPQFCASLDAEAGELIYKKYVHIGFAADTPQGLVVPVVRDADRKDVFELARDLAELSEKARAGKLTAADMQGGCFTISSLGGIGGTAFTPIINAPEVAILGVSRSTHRPVYKDGGFVPRLMLPLSLSYDHRVIDGAAAVRFTTFLASALANVDGLLRAIP